MTEEQKKQPSQTTSILVNVIIPVIVLTMLSKDKFLGPTWGMIAALILPVGYGLLTLIKDRRMDWFSLLGTIGILLTGVFAIKELPAIWMASKEAAIPLIFGLAIVISLKTPYPLIKKILMTEAMFDVNLLKSKLKELGNEEKFEKRLVWLTWGLASSMFLSSILNFVLAMVVLKGEPGTVEYTEQIGKMVGLGYVVVLIPSMTIMIAVFYSLSKTLTSLTGLKFDDILADQHKEKKPEEDPIVEEPIAD